MTTTRWKRCYEGLRGARFVSPFFANFHWPFWWVLGCVVLLVCFLFWFFVLHSISVSHLLRISSS